MDAEWQAAARERLLRDVRAEVGGCWTWQAARHPAGYGSLGFRGKHWYASRFAYAAFVGDPGRLHVCHHCDNPPCCNPDHLFLGTHAENHRDKARKGRTGKEKRFGEKNARSKLTDEAVRRILASDASGGALAREFGVSRTLINMIRRREIWRHVNV